jgi:hypothetical protein
MEIPELLPQVCMMAPENPRLVSSYATPVDEPIEVRTIMYRRFGKHRITNVWRYDFVG